jgi:hypothetical protein
MNSYAVLGWQRQQHQLHCRLCGLISTPVTALIQACLLDRVEALALCGVWADISGVIIRASSTAHKRSPSSTLNSFCVVQCAPWSRKHLPGSLGGLGKFLPGFLGEVDTMRARNFFLPVGPIPTTSPRPLTLVTPKRRPKRPVTSMCLKQKCWHSRHSIARRRRRKPGSLQSILNSKGTRGVSQSKQTTLFQTHVTYVSSSSGGCLTEW